MKKGKIFWIYLAISLLFSSFAYSATKTPLETVDTVASCLVQSQRSFGGWGGGEELNYTGPIVAGLVQAYEITDNNDYRDAAIRGADFIILFSGLNFLGDEAYSIARLGSVTKNKVYTNIIREFYDKLDTPVYIEGYNQTIPEKAAFYISFHAVAAKMVKARDAEIWRKAIIKYLAQVEDNISYFPVMTLSVTTWALAQTGPMDETPIDPLGSVGLEYWKDKTLRDMPYMLAKHQVRSGDFARSFYVRYDHTSPGEGYYDAGYTEDTIFGLLGLISANNYREDINDINDIIDFNDIDDIGEIDVNDLINFIDLNDVNGIDPNCSIVLEADANDPNIMEYKLCRWNFDKNIQDAREVLINAVHFSGIIGAVQEHIWDGNQMYYYFGGELLETFDKKYVYPKKEDEEEL